MQSVEYYQKEFNSYLKNEILTKDPVHLYEPMVYILGLGGKRLRPVLLLMTTAFFGGNYKDALDAALAIEVFHNFSLVHDDIMDDAPLRRGKTTVHEKWDLNTGILSGDAMLINSYQFFNSYEGGTFKSLVQLFSTTAMQVCEGQQYDVDFETRDDVTLAEYIRMITYKTAVLVAGAMKMGAIIANASSNDQNSIYEFGKNLGIAFQLQDDYLDAFGNQKSFGKRMGGDIIENKKTFLYLNSLALAAPEEVKELEHLFSLRPRDTEHKINTVKEIYINSGAASLAKQEIENYTEKAFSRLDGLKVPESKKNALREFGKILMNREI